MGAKGGERLMSSASTDTILLTSFGRDGFRGATAVRMAFARSSSMVNTTPPPKVLTTLRVSRDRNPALPRLPRYRPSSDCTPMPWALSSTTMRFFSSARARMPSTSAASPFIWVMIITRVFFVIFSAICSAEQLTRPAATSARTGTNPEAAITAGSSTCVYAGRMISSPVSRPRFSRIIRMPNRPEDTAMACLTPIRRAMLSSKRPIQSPSRASPRIKALRMSRIIPG